MQSTFEWSIIYGCLVEYNVLIRRVFLIHFFKKEAYPGAWKDGGR